jgi:hypothetical protein
MLWRKGINCHPSLRRHYPDQVYGSNLRLATDQENLSLRRAKHPGNPPAVRQAKNMYCFRDRFKNSPVFDRQSQK